MLKPGSVLGVVAYRANPDMAVAKSYKLGRSPQGCVINEAQKAGFRLAATSEFNANTKESRKMPIWYLPPTLQRGDKNRGKYQAIGEGDNMTLKFVKPQ